MGTAVEQWLRCCTTNRKVPVSEFFIGIKSSRSHYGPGVESASNRNEYQEYFLGVKEPCPLELLSVLLIVGTAVAQWLRCCAANRKVPVSGFFIGIKSFRSHCGPGVESASNINEYQEYFLRVKAAGA